MNHLKVWLKPLEIIRMVTENLLNRGRNRGTVNRSKVVKFLLSHGCISDWKAD